MTQGTLEPLIANRIELLIGSLGIATKVAECLGVSRPLLSKWRAGTVMPSPAQLKLLVDLDHVMARAALIYAPEVAHDWLYCHDSYLEGARPITLCTSAGCEQFSMLSTRGSNALGAGRPAVDPGESFRRFRCPDHR